MKISEISNVVPHPNLTRAKDYTTLIVSGDDRLDEIIAFIMDDNNAIGRRMNMLRHLDELLGDEQQSYSYGDLEQFMHDQGEISQEEADEIAQDLKLPPYHLQSVKEEDEDLPTGEYEVCPHCHGEGCHYCNDEGLIDVTGMHKIPDFKDLDIPDDFT